MNPADQTHASVRKLLEFIENAIDFLRDFSVDAHLKYQMFDVFQRGSIIRQYEALKSILKMHEAGIGEFAPSLIRPAFEEMAWNKYLNKNRSVADELLTLIAGYEARSLLEEQSVYLGTEGMRSIGFTQSYVKKTVAALRGQDARLREIGRALGWNERNQTPSFSFICTKTGLTNEYKYLYRATSRYVHFSPHQILRMCWGSGSKFNISMKHFSHYFADFSMYWSSWILASTMELSEALVMGGYMEQIVEFKEKVEHFRKVQIITKTEIDR